MRLPSAKVCELSVITSAENGAFFTPARSIPAPDSLGPPAPAGPAKPMRPRPPPPGGGPCAHAAEGVFFPPTASIPAPDSLGPPAPAGPLTPMPPRPPRPGGGPCAKAPAASAIRATIVIRIVIPLFPVKPLSSCQTSKLLPNCLIQETHGARDAVGAEQDIGLHQFLLAIGADI